MYVRICVCATQALRISILGPPLPTPSQAMPRSLPRPKQIVAQKRILTTYFADGTTHVSGGQKRNVCKKFSGDPRKICFDKRTKWTNGMCRAHAKEAGCQPPPKKAKTLRICNVCEQIEKNEMVHGVLPTPARQAESDAWACPKCHQRWLRLLHAKLPGCSRKDKTSDDDKMKGVVTEADE